MSNYLFLDIETKSFSDLPSVGAWKYSEHPTTDVICLAYAFDNNPVSVLHDELYPLDFYDIGKDSFFVARNALFEYAIIHNVLIPRYGWPKEMLDPRRWICTAALSRMHGLPASLDPCAEYINKVNKKLPDGKRLINLYSKPVKDRKTGELSFRPIPPDDMQRFRDYNIADVEADRECFPTLMKLPNWEIEKEAFWHDLEMNIQGLRIDIPALEKITKQLDKKLIEAEQDTEKYGLNVKSPKQLREWLAEKEIYIPNTRIDTIEELFETTTNEDVKNVLALRMFLAKASVKKYYAIEDRKSEDGRLRYFMRYFGAHTGRYSGEGVQLHNLPKAGKTTADEIETLIKNIRPDMGYKELIEAGKKILPGMILPSGNSQFILGDFAAIEARGVAYLSGCNTLLRQFQNNEDVYTIMAGKINPSKPNRQLGKTIILGCGYGMGVDKFYATCKKQGLDIPLVLAETSVKTYRGVYAEIPSFWYEVERAFRDCWNRKTLTKAGKYITFERGSNYIKVKLPSGRYLFYHKVQIDSRSNEISYFNFSKKMRVKLWGGVLVENITQAMCRDIMTDRILELEKQGLKVAFSVHDEIIAECDEGKETDSQIMFDKIMNEPPSWLPRFPLKTESEISRRYHK